MKSKTRFGNPFIHVNTWSERVGREPLELCVSRLGESGLRIALFHHDITAAQTFPIKLLRDEDTQYQVAQQLVRQVRPQAGPHVAYEVARMIQQHVEKF